MGAAADKAREAMIAYLKSGESKPPHAVTSPPEKDDDGVITPGFEEGALFLKHADGRFFRLDWAAPAAGKLDRRRGLPPGDYTLTGYRLMRRDEKGVAWFLSGTGSNLRTVKVAAGVETRIAVEEAIRLKCSAKGDKELKINVGIAGEKGCGLTIYKEGKRIDLVYQVRDAKGAVLASGTMAYG